MQHRKYSLAGKFRLYKQSGIQDSFSKTNIFMSVEKCQYLYFLKKKTEKKEKEKENNKIFLGYFLFLLTLELTLILSPLIVVISLKACQSLSWASRYMVWVKTVCSRKIYWSKFQNPLSTRSCLSLLVRALWLIKHSIALFLVSVLTEENKITDREVKFNCLELFH